MRGKEKTYLEGWLKVEGGDPIRVGRYCWIGGEKGDAIHVASPRFTERGAQVARLSAQEFELRSLQHRHPVFLNSREVWVPKILNSGDVIRVGPTSVQFRAVRKPAYQVDRLHIIDWDGFLEALERAKRNRVRVGSFAIVRRDGAVTKCSPDARVIFTKMFGRPVTNSVPEELLNWLEEDSAAERPLIRVRGNPLFQDRTNHVGLRRGHTSPADIAVVGRFGTDERTG